MLYCVRCGKQLQDTDVHCPGCGKRAQGMPLMPATSRLAGHIRLLGIFWLALSALRLIPVLILMALFSPGWHLFPHGVPAFVPGLVRLVATLLLVGAVLGLIAGWGLLTRQPWARMLAIVLGCISLINLPFGTALGIYTLWVLLPAESEQEYRQISQAP